MSSFSRYLSTMQLYEVSHCHPLGGNLVPQHPEVLVYEMSESHLDGCLVDSPAQFLGEIFILWYRYISTPSHYHLHISPFHECWRSITYSTSSPNECSARIILQSKYWLQVGTPRPFRWSCRLSHHTASGDELRRGPLGAREASEHTLSQSRALYYYLLF